MDFEMQYFLSFYFLVLSSHLLYLAMLDLGVPIPANVLGRYNIDDPSI
jgi:hypothetical protein